MNMNRQISCLIVIATIMWGIQTSCESTTPVDASLDRRPATLADLAFSGVAILGGDYVPWTQESGILIFSVVRNLADEGWSGNPQAAVYKITQDNKIGELIAANNGVLTSWVDRATFTPTDKLKGVPGNSETESLTFVPNDWQLNPVVFVYWRFADQKENGRIRFKSVLQGKVKSQSQIITRGELWKNL